MSTYAEIAADTPQWRTVAALERIASALEDLAVTYGAREPGR